MKLHTRFAALLFALTAYIFASSAAWADTHEAVADDAMVQMERMITALEKVTDKPTAEKAVEDLMSVAAELKKVAVRAKEVGKPAADVKAKIEAKMKEKQEAMMKRMGAVQGAIAKAGPEAGAVLMKGMQEFGAAMMEVGKAFEEADKK
jgi:hypothetical protein